MTPEQLIRNDILFAAEQIGDQVMAELEEHHDVCLQNLVIDTNEYTTVQYSGHRVGVNVIPQYVGGRIIGVTLDSQEIDELQEPLTIELSEQSIKQWGIILGLIPTYDALSDISYLTPNKGQVL